MGLLYWGEFGGINPWALLLGMMAGYFYYADSFYGGVDTCITYGICG